MNKYTEFIENYLQGRMNPTERVLFEARLAQEPELKAEFMLQQRVMKGIERAGIRSEVSSGLKKGSFKSKLKTWTTAVLITGLTVATVLVLINKVLNDRDNNIGYERNEANTQEWSDADKYIAPELFKIKGNRDTVIETKGGIIFTIPARAFLDAKGDEVPDEIEIEVKEALTASDIIQAGLSNTSNGKLLETGGMFFLNARKDGKNLLIAQNKGIYTSIPNFHPDKDMQLFEGQRTKNGQINWVNPKSFEKKLQNVDILKLNFYPQGFLDSLKAFGFNTKNKRLTDSIYYSFVCGVPKSDSAVNEFDEADSLIDNRPALSVSPINQIKPDGAALFSRNCSACHSIGTQKLTGPGLAGMMERVPSKEWLIHYILNNEKLIKSGDPYANKLYNENRKATMTVFEGQLSENDVESIIDFILSRSPEKVTNSGRSECGIDPSRIHAIWDKKFNNTLLATKEFEERLQAIFKTCNHSILDLYVANINKKMYQVDSMASEMLHEVEGPEMPTPFRHFYLRKDGGVSINEGHMQKLYAYMEEKQKEYQQAVVQSKRLLFEKEHIMDQKALENRFEQNQQEAQRSLQTFSEELEINLNEAYRQLGKPRPRIAPIPGNYLGTTLVNTGWYNVDKYVIESTMKRKTLDYTDPETKRKAVIHYEPFVIKVTNVKDFDRTYAYLIPNQLSSFQRLSEVNNGFKENLNELLNYKSIVIGFKGETLYGTEINSVKPGQITVVLKKASSAILSKFDSGNSNALNNVLNDVNYQAFEQKETTRKATIAKREEIESRLWPVVFPCGQPPSPPAQQALIEM